MMKMVHSCHDPLLANHLRNLLEQEGIRCSIVHDHLASGAGELPPTECWPELWCSDKEEQRARALLGEILTLGKQPSVPWTCPGCREEIEGQFNLCWNCLSSRPE